MNTIDTMDMEGRMLIELLEKSRYSSQYFQVRFPKAQPPSEESNQVILPNSLLKQFMDEAVEFPIFLELSRITSTGETKTTHVTPANYETQIEAIYAPYQVLSDLGLFESQNESPVKLTEEEASSSMDVDEQKTQKTVSKSSPYPTTGEGCLVTLKTVKLPQGTTATLQPLSFGWVTEVPEDQQKAVLEHQLRRFQCLSLNETIKFTHHNKQYSFHVTELAPSDGVSLLSTDLAVNILAPIDAPMNTDLTHGLHILSKKEEEKTSLDRIIHMYKGDSLYFTLEMVNPNQAVLLELEPIEGFPAAIYACTRRHYPTPADHTWSSENLSDLSEKQIKQLQQTGKRTVLLSQDNPDFSVGHLYIGIHSPFADSSFKFIVFVGLKSELALGNASMTSGSLLSSSGGGSVPPNSSKCSNCSRWIPDATFTLHQVQCSRRNWKCPQCQFVCPVEEKEKHMSISHTAMTCECGFSSEAELVALHKEFECDLRPFICPHCNLSMPLKQRASHLKECGNRTSQCPTCQLWIKNNEMALHQAELHQNGETTPMEP